MSTANKLTYLNQTKQKLKQAINNIGGSIDEQTTFRQYANQLQEVYDNLPKTEYQEGTEVNLGVTIKGKLDYEDGVVGIGQSSQESTTGKNLLPPFIKGVRLNATTGEEESISTGASTDFIPVNFTTNPNYYLSGLIDTIHTTVWAYNSSKQGLHRSSNQNRTSLAINSSIFTGGTAQGTGDIAYIRVCYRVEAGDTGVISDIDNLKMQLEIGSSATAWEQYTGRNS